MELYYYFTAFVRSDRIGRFIVQAASVVGAGVVGRALAAAGAGGASGTAGRLMRQTPVPPPLVFTDYYTQLYCYLCKVSAVCAVVGIFLTHYCFICKVSLLFSATCAK